LQEAMRQVGALLVRSVTYGTVLVRAAA